MELQTLASCSSPAPASAVGWTSSSTPRFVFRRRSPLSIGRWAGFQQRFRPPRAIAAAFFACDGGPAAAGRRQRRKRVDARPRDGGDDVELEILKFMEQSGRPNVFPSKEELIAAGRGDLVDAAVKKGGWLTVGWEFGRKSPDQVEAYVNGSGRKKDRSKTGSRDKDEEHSVRLNGHATETFPSKEVLVDGIEREESSSPPADAPPPCYIRNGTGRRQVRKKISVLPQLDKITSGVPEVNPEASHERWRRKRRKKTASIAAESSATVKDALSWIQDMVQKREQCIIESRSRTSKQQRTTATTPEFPSADGKQELSPPPPPPPPLEPKRPSRIFPAEVPARDSAGGKSLTVWPSTSGRLSSASRSSPDAQNPASLTRPRSSSRLYSSRTSGLPKTSTSSGLISSPVGDGSRSFSSRLRDLETRLLATRAALKSGRATLLKGEDKLMQVQRKTSEDLARAADTLEFKETEIMQTRAELRRTRAQVTALQAKMALELSEARKAADEKQVLLDRAENALKMLRFVRIVWPNAASHVLLTGSFDGWTNRIKMEKSGAGVFVTALHLYPGRYEVKFIVDGTWRVDPCRPITYADGIENNVLMVS